MIEIDSDGLRNIADRLQALIRRALITTRPHDGASACFGFSVGFEVFDIDSLSNRLEAPSSRSELLSKDFAIIRSKSRSGESSVDIHICVK